MQERESCDVEDTVRTMIHRENDLIHQRVTWLTTLQGLLFTALGVAWDKPAVIPFVHLLCFLGMALAAILFSLLAGATAAMHRLYAWWEEHKPQDYDGPDVIGLKPRKWPLSQYLGPWSFIPALFLLAWIIVWRLKG